MKILLVEDDLADADYFRHQMKTASDVDFVVEARLSSAIRRASSEAFDLVVLDLTLPDCDGLETLFGFQSEVASPPASG